MCNETYPWGNDQLTWAGAEPSRLSFANLGKCLPSAEDVLAEGRKRLELAKGHQQKQRISIWRRSKRRIWYPIQVRLERCNVVRCNRIEDTVNIFPRTSSCWIIHDLKHDLVQGMNILHGMFCQLYERDLK